MVFLDLAEGQLLVILYDHWMAKVCHHVHYLSFRNVARIYVHRIIS